MSTISKLYIKIATLVSLKNKNLKNVKNNINNKQQLSQCEWVKLYCVKNEFFLTI